MSEDQTRKFNTPGPESRRTITEGILRLEYIPCPLCNSNDTSLIQTSKDNLYGIPGEFTVERCNNCQHRFMNPRPVLECLGDCYPDHYGPHQSESKEPVPSAAETSAAQVDSVSASRPLYLRILPLRYVPGLKRCYNWLIDDGSQPVPPVSELSPADNPGHDRASESPHRPHALEIGCATGEYLVRLQQAGWKATGIEPGVRPATIAKTRGLDVQCGMLETSQLPTASFDIAAAWMVIEHVPDPRDTLQRIHELLKPGGILYFSIPNAGCWEAGFFGGNWFALELPRHLHQFTPTSIRILLEQCGYSNISITHQRNLSYVSGSLGQMILSRWPTSRLGRRLFNYPHRPTFGMKLFLAPWAHLIALMGQGGRLTISAQRNNDMQGAPS